MNFSLISIIIVDLYFVFLQVSTHDHEILDYDNMLVEVFNMYGSWSM